MIVWILFLSFFWNKRGKGTTYSLHTVILRRLNPDPIFIAGDFFLYIIGHPAVFFCKVITTLKDLLRVKSTRVGLVLQMPASSSADGRGMAQRKAALHAGGMQGGNL